MKTLTVAALSGVAAMALSAAAIAAPAPAPAAPAAPQVTYGANVPGVCYFSDARAIGTAAYGKAITAQLTTLQEAVNKELQADAQKLDADAKALDGKRATITQESYEQQALILQQQQNGIVRKRDLRVRELEATQEEQFGQFGQVISPMMAQVFQTRQCSFLIDRDALLIASPGMDITDDVVKALDAVRKTTTFERKRLPQ